MGGDLDRTITYTYRVINNISGPSEEAANSQKHLSDTLKQTAASSNLAADSQRNLGESQQNLNTTLRQTAASSNLAADSQRNLGDTIKDTNAASDSQKISFMTQVIAVQALHRGISGINSGLQDLGFLSGNAALMMNKLNSTVQVVAGTFQLFKGITQIMKMWTAAEVSLATVQTYRAVLTNPAKVALAVTGLSVAAGVGGFMLGSRGQGGESNVTQTVNFNGAGTLSPSDSRSVARDALSIMGG